MFNTVYKCNPQSDRWNMVQQSREREKNIHLGHRESINLSCAEIHSLDDTDASAAAVAEIYMSWFNIHYSPRWTLAGPS